MSGLPEILGKEVHLRGPIPFARFMELALYCPDYGYYEREQETIGREGDYITSVSVGSLFGHLLAWQLARWLEKITGPSLRLVEAGAHRGLMARDILDWLRRCRPEVLDRISYVIVEPSPVRRAAQKAQMQPWLDTTEISWHTTLEQLDPHGFEGILLANELLDAMPVHRLGWDRAHRRWFEWGVGLESDAWRLVPLPEPSLDIRQAMDAADIHLTSELLEVLPDGFTIEVCPSAADWWRRAGRHLHRGMLLTIDYGLEAEQFLQPHRKEGTLRAYYRHHMASSLLERPGQQDLTAHVNFTSLRRIGHEEGLETLHDESQAAFFTRIAKNIWEGDAAFGFWTPSHTRQFQMLTHPDHFGSKFRVLVQSRA